MASTAQDAYLPALDHHHREEVGRELRTTLVELVDMSSLPAGARCVTTCDRRTPPLLVCLGPSW